MSGNSIFRAKNHVLVLALAAAYPCASFAAGAARIDFVNGSVTAVSASGAQRPLVKGAEVGSGEAVITGPTGRTQLRFTDGGMVSLQPQSEFRIDDYRFSGKGGGEEKGFFSLLKGGMRTITGLIGRENRSGYRVTTTVATIGIRGTEYTAGLSPDGAELLVHTGEGRVEVCSDVSCIQIGSGESGAVSGRNGHPQRTEVRPLLAPAQPETSLLPVFSTADTFNDLFVPTSPMPVTGTGSYSTILTQAIGPSQLTSASISVDFGSLDVVTDLKGIVNSQSFGVQTWGSVGGNTFVASSVETSSGAFCGFSGCTASVSGTFYGPAAERVGISYSVTNFSSQTASGSATIGR